MADEYIEGARQLSVALKELPDNIGRNVLRRAVSAAAAVVRDQARQNAPVDTGEMKRDIMTKRERTQNNLSARYSVFVRTGKKSRMAGAKRNVERDSFYWRFVEFGTSKMAAQPFMRPAWQQQQGAAAALIVETLKTEIPKEVSKLSGGKA